MSVYLVVYKIGMSTHEYYCIAKSGIDAINKAKKRADKDAKDYVDETARFQSCGLVDDDVW